MTIFGNFWQILVTFGNIWQLLATFWQFRQHLAIFGYFSGKKLATLKEMHLLLILALFGSYWQLLTAFGYFWQLLSPFWLLLATFVFFCYCWQQATNIDIFGLSECQHLSNSSILSHLFLSRNEGSLMMGPTCKGVLFYHSLLRETTKICLV